MHLYGSAPTSPSRCTRRGKPSSMVACQQIYKHEGRGDNFHNGSVAAQRRPLRSTLPFGSPKHLPVPGPMAPLIHRWIEREWNSDVRKIGEDGPIFPASHPHETTLGEESTPPPILTRGEWPARLRTFEAMMGKVFSFIGLFALRRAHTRRFVGQLKPCGWTRIRRSTIAKVTQARPCKNKEALRESGMYQLRARTYHDL